MFMKMLEIDPQEIRIEDLSVLYPDFSSVSVSDTKLVSSETELLTYFKQLRVVLKLHFGTRDGMVQFVVNR